MLIFVNIKKFCYTEVFFICCIGYKEVVAIPAGSRNIKVEEVGNSRNYIGIGSATSGRFFLNGKR
jgi:hypothetical protein